MTGGINPCFCLMRLPLLAQSVGSLRRSDTSVVGGEADMPTSFKRRLPSRHGPECYSITSSARLSTVGGMVSPIAFAVLRLMTSSYLVGAWTGRSDGFSPLRMRST
jgi:hypothetical protein